MKHTIENYDPKYMEEYLKAKLYLFNGLLEKHGKSILGKNFDLMFEQ